MPPFPRPADSYLLGSDPPRDLQGSPVVLLRRRRRAGDDAGEGLTQFGAEWYVLGPDGAKVDAA
jgi:hypothetical protein